MSRAGAFFRRDLRLAAHQRVPFLMEITSAVFVVLEFRLLSVLVPAGQVTGDYFAFVTAGLVVSAFVVSGISVMATTVRQQQVQGTLEVLVSTGLPLRIIAAGIAGYPLLMAAVRGAIFVVLAAVFGVRVPQANWLLAMLALAAGSVAFAAMGLMAAALVLVFRQAVAVTTWLVAGLVAIGGVVFPLSVLPPWAQDLVTLSPVVPALEVVRAAALNGAPFAAEWRALALLCVMAIAYGGLALWALATAIRHAKRAGTLATY